METRPFFFDPATKSRTLWHQDYDGNVVIENESDVEDVVEEAKTLYNMHDERARWAGDVHHVASIPMIILMELNRTGVLHDQKKYKEWLNERDNRVFRTRPGTV